MKKKLTLISLALIVLAFMLTSCAVKMVNVRFYVDDELYSSASIKSGEAPTFPSDPTKEGYAFSGWLDPLGVVQSAETLSKGIKEDLVLKASFVICHYQITYEVGGGSLPEDAITSYTISTSDQDLPVPTCPGYKFLGWLYDGELLEVIPAGVVGDLALVASYEGETHSITFDARGGTVSPTVLYAVNGTSITLPTPKRTGYVFSGWALDGATVVYTKADFTEDVELVAQWELDVYNIVYHLNGGMAPGLNEQYTIETETFTLPLPIRDGYDFLGWTGTDLEQATLTATVEKGSTGWREYQATWRRHTASITFVENGGTDCLDLLGGSGDELMLPRPTRAGYTFVGWYRDEELSISFTDEVYPYDDITLYAKWKAKTYTIFFSGVERESITYTIEEAVLIADPKREGYTFNGWTAEFLDAPKTGLVISTEILRTMLKDFTLVAHWTVNSVTISFDSRGGSAVAPLTACYGEKITSPAAPTNDRGSFAGWYQDRSYETPYAFTTMPAESMTLYAKWDGIAMYKLSYEASLAGCVSGNFASGDWVFPGEEVTLLAVYEDSGFIFADWRSNASVVKRTLSYSFTMPKRDVSLVARYVTTREVTYDRASGDDLVLSASGTISAVQGEDITTNDYTLSTAAATISASFASALYLGRHVFLLEGTSDQYISVNVTSSAMTPQEVKLDYDTAYPLVLLKFEEKESSYACSIDGGEYFAVYSGMTLEDYDKSRDHEITVIDLVSGLKTIITRRGYSSSEKEYYLSSFTWCGETYDYFFETVDEFRIWVEYSVMVNGIENGTATTKYPNGTFSTDGVLSEDLLALKTSLFTDAMQRFSCPMGLAYSYSFADTIVTFLIWYTTSFNDITSSQIGSTVIDLQGLLKESTRTDDYDDFKINSFIKTEEISTIYELEELSYGVRPIIEEGTVASEVYQEALSVLRDIIDDAMSDYEKVKAMYDWIGLNVTYDAAVASDSEHCGAYRAFTIAGVFLDHIAVCDGIASAMQLMCDIEGIECIEVIGSSEGYGHAWNKVKIDGCWLGVDATWARATVSSYSSKTSAFITHAYLFLDEAALIANEHFEAGFAKNPSVLHLATSRYDYYHLTIVDQNKDYDLVADSSAEYLAIIAWAKEQGMSYVDFKATVAVSYNYTISCANGEVVYVLKVS